MTATLSKADLRAAALAKRDALSEEQRAAAAQAMAMRGVPFAIEPGMIVSGYSPIRSEIDPAPLMRKLALPLDVVAFTVTIYATLATIQVLIQAAQNGGVIDVAP